MNAWRVASRCWKWMPFVLLFVLFVGFLWTVPQVRGPLLFVLGVWGGLMLWAFIGHWFDAKADEWRPPKGPQS